MKGRVLIIYSDEQNSASLGEALRARDYEVQIETHTSRAIEVSDTFAPTAIITDTSASDADGFVVLRDLRTIQPHTPIIVIAKDSSVETVVRAIQEEGAYHYFEEPVDLDKLSVVLERAFEYSEARRENEILRRQLRDRGAFGELVGESETMKKVYNLIEQVASSSASVLITGESGTGKELAARTIHILSPRRNAPFL